MRTVKRGLGGNFKDVRRDSVHILDQFMVGEGLTTFDGVRHLRAVADLVEKERKHDSTDCILY